MTECSGYISRVLKKYAFIVSDEEFTFLHPSNYLGDFETLRPGMQVSFKRIKTDKGYNGLEVKNIE